MNVVISNRSRPDFGQFSVQLPIPSEQYDQVIEKLETLKIGGVTACDCHVDEIHSCPFVLKRLEGTQVNIDELDFLCKRLDSFAPNELSTFSALAEMHGFKEMLDLINLCDSCYSAMTVTDFSSMERVGKGYLLTKNGGAMSVDELKQYDLVTVARNLLSGSKGTVTPYGVLFDEGFSLESVYDGTMLPPFYYQPGLVNIQIITERDPDNCPEFCLPDSNLRIRRFMERIGYQDGDSYNVVILDSELPQEISERLSAATEDVFGLNNAVSSLAELDQSEYEKLCAVMEFSRPRTASQIRTVIDQMDMFEFVPGTKDAEDVGRYLIIESGHYAYDPELEDYIDFEACGLDHAQWQEGRFGEYGYVGYSGDERLFFSMENEQIMTMGGMT